METLEAKEQGDRAGMAKETWHTQPGQASKEENLTQCAGFAFPGLVSGGHRVGFCEKLPEAFSIFTRATPGAPKVWLAKAGQLEMVELPLG